MPFERARCILTVYKLLLLLLLRSFFSSQNVQARVSLFVGKFRASFVLAFSPNLHFSKTNNTRANTHISSGMFEKLFAWCGLHRPGKEDGKDNRTTGGSDDLTIDDNSSDVGSEAGSSMISVEELDPVTGKPTRVLKKKKSLIGRAYRKVTKSRSGKNKKSGGAEEDGVAAAGGVAGGGA